MMNFKHLLPALFFTLVVSSASADDGIQWILDKYDVSAPVSLIPAEGLHGWTAHYGKPLTRTKWTNKGGKLFLEKIGNEYEHELNDLVTEKQYTNFILDFDWVATKGCNSGVKYRLKDFGAVGAKINWSETFGWLGCEYQVLDDPNNHEGNKGNGEWSTAALYSALAPNKEKKKLHPFGEVNHGRIVVLDHHIEHWLNGENVLEYEMGSDAWKEAHAKSKFANAEGFGKNPTGFIMLQDHGHQITYEKIVIREIKAAK
jgi:hypothetical protein